jgi:hypothetical protein
MPQTIRVHWDSFKGRRVLNFNWGAINKESVVIVTASEYHGKGQPLFQGESDPRFVGAAAVRVDDIAPHGPPSDPNEGVTFAVTVDWPDPLPIVTDITVLDNPPVEVQYAAGAITE